MIEERFGYSREQIVALARDMRTVWRQREVAWLLGIDKVTVRRWTNDSSAEKLRSRGRERVQRADVKAKRLDASRTPDGRVKQRAYTKKYKQRPEIKAKVRVHTKTRRANDPVFRATGSLYTRYWRWTNTAPKKGVKRKKPTNADRKKESVSVIRDLLGCTVAKLFNYFESGGLMQPGMTRENYGKAWNIAHVRPLASFDRKDVEQRKLAWHFTNLAPQCRRGIQRGDL